LQRYGPPILIVVFDGALLILGMFSGHDDQLSISSRFNLQTEAEFTKIDSFLQSVHGRPGIPQQPSIWHTYAFSC
jgi:hypothetical protein